MFQRNKIGLVFLLAVFLATVISGCSSSENDTGSPSMAPLDSMPEEVRSAPAIVHQAYQFAVANPDILTKLPCYCGCGAMGHTSNYDCYVSGVDGNGSILFDTHALGCSICVDITQDAMRLTAQGKSVSEIRQYVDQTYAQYGPSNIP